MRKLFAILLAGTLFNPGMVGAAPKHESGPKTDTPIRHLVVIFQENVSFDHYFATYPTALNLSGERPFYAKPGHSYSQWLG